MTGTAIGDDTPVIHEPAPFKQTTEGNTMAERYSDWVNRSKHASL
jgi:hypothetical protein